MTSKLSLCLDRFPGDDKPHTSLQENGIGDLLASGVTSVKIHNSPGYLRWVRQNYPSVVAVGRNTGVDEWFKDNMKPGTVSPDVIASTWYQKMRSDIEATGSGIYWCWPYCEPNKDDIDALNQIALSMMRLGVPLVIGEFSAEFNLYDVEDRFKPALDAAIAGGHILGLHAYDNNLPAPGNRRLVDSPYLYPNKRLKSKVKKLITELGIDAIFSENRMCSGWKNSGLSAPQFANWVIAADVEFRKDPTVIGETVYISSRNKDDKEKAPFFTSFRDAGKGKEPPPPCVDDLILQYNYAQLGIIEVPPVDPPPVDPPPATGVARVKVVNVKDYLNVRAGPGTSYASIGRLPRGLVFEVETPYNAWAKVAGVAGYVSSTYIQKA